MTAGSSAPLTTLALVAAGAIAVWEFGGKLLNKTDNHSHELPPPRPRKKGEVSRPSITLVGAGPGDVELLTLAAVRALREADLVLVDQIVSEELAAHIGCEWRLAPSKKDGAYMSAQDQLNEWGLQAVRDNKAVVRLKSGDPGVFGRATEEAEFYASHGFKVKVVPGVSSALAAPLAAGIPITSRGVAHEFLTMTGMLEAGKPASWPLYSAGRTLILLMSVGRLPGMSSELKDLEYPADCPVAVIESACTSKQKVTECTVGGIDQLSGVKSPSVIVIGHVVSHRLF